MASDIQLHAIQRLESDGWTTIDSRNPHVYGGPTLMKRTEAGNTRYIIITPNGDQTVPTDQQVDDYY